MQIEISGVGLDGSGLMIRSVLDLLMSSLYMYRSCGFISLDNDEQSAESTYLPIIGSGPATDGGVTSPLERTR